MTTLYVEELGCYKAAHHKLGINVVSPKVLSVIARKSWVPWRSKTNTPQIINTYWQLKVLSSIISRASTWSINGCHRWLQTKHWPIVYNSSVTQICRNINIHKIKVLLRLASFLNSKCMVVIGDSDENSNGNSHDYMECHL